MEDCIFCKIVVGEIPAEIVYRSEEIIAFRDINPEAPVHVQIIPRKHIASIADISGDEYYLAGEMVKAANQLAKYEGIAESGYRLTMNCGKQGGQLVPHLHMHLLGGRQMSNKLG